MTIDNELIDKLQVVTELKNRGVKDILSCVDGLVFPKRLKVSFHKPRFSYALCT